MVIGIILGIIGMSTLVGGLAGAVTGEGVAAGMMHGANFLGNSFEAVGSLFRGDFKSAGLQMLGVSDQVVADFSEGEYNLHRSNYDIGSMDILFGDYQYDDIEAHKREAGIDLISGLATVVGLKAAEKWGGQVLEKVTGNGMMLFFGKSIGENNVRMDNIVEAIGESNNYDISPIYGATGSPTRYDRSEKENETVTSYDIEHDDDEEDK
jgi:hypothetical protein